MDIMGQFLLTVRQAAVKHLRWKDFQLMTIN